MDVTNIHTQLMDDITCELIDPENLVTLVSGTDNILHSFDIKTLEKLYRDSQESSKPFVNPFTRQPIPTEIVTRIKQFSESLYITISVNNAGKCNDAKIHRKESLGHGLLNIFRQVRKTVREILVHDVLVNSVSVYNYSLETPYDEITFHREKKRSRDDFEKLGHYTQWELVDLRDKGLHSPEMCFDLERIYPKLYRFGLSKSLEWLTAEHMLIPYRHNPRPLDEPIPGSKDRFIESLEILKSDLPSETEDADDAEDAEDEDAEDTDLNREYVYDFMMNLLMVASTSLITAEEAREIISHLPPKPYHTAGQHVILARVVDKHNLNPTGVEGLYVRNRYQQPDYRLRINRRFIL